ncbi:ribonuclease P [Ignicoccus pacificus DSM 13166]|uniref:Ribonuclease P protein component 2 n=1 Tax=Ignicoccus pacificus DSM 13166 TaxID=940294 RepID=A0A977KA53_9CREN|nr:ribonuclease P [Ignicoccus pacificus DSM 13166]
MFGGTTIAIVALILSLVSILWKRECVVRVEKVNLSKKREKERRRYVLMQVLAEEPEKLDPSCLQEAMKEAIEKGYGRIGLAIANPKLVYFDLNTNSIIVRCDLEGKEILASSTMLLKEACGTRVRLIPLRAFGTLKSAREKIPKVA